MVKACFGLTDLPKLPSSLQGLEVDNCLRITSLPDLPGKLTSLRIFNSAWIASLPELPGSLNFLHLKYCLGITSLPVLPGSLIELQVHDCARLTSLPEFPKLLRFLTVKDCPNLTGFPELPSSLMALQMNNDHGRSEGPETMEKEICMSSAPSNNTFEKMLLKIAATLNVVWAAIIASFFSSSLATDVPGGSIAAVLAWLSAFVVALFQGVFLIALISIITFGVLVIAILWHDI